PRRHWLRQGQVERPAPAHRRADVELRAAGGGRSEGLARGETDLRALPCAGALQARPDQAVPALRSGQGQHAEVQRDADAHRRLESEDAQVPGNPWHANPDNEIRFEYLDPERDKVGKVTLLTKGQVVVEYLPPGTPQKSAGVRSMDCIDCHN